MGNWCSKSYLPSSMMQSKQNRFWKGKGMVGPAHSHLRTVTLNNASHHHLTVQTVVWCFTSSSYSVDCCIAHCNSEQCFTSPSYSALLYDASHHHLTVQTVVWCFTSSSYSADCCMMLHIILQCRLLYDASHHLTVQTVVWCFTSSYSVDCCIAHCNSEQCFTSSYSADCCMMLYIIILQCRLLYDALHHHLTVQTVVWCFTSSSYSVDCCMMLHIIILQCRLLYDALHHHLTVQTELLPHPVNIPGHLPGAS